MLMFLNHWQKKKPRCVFPRLGCLSVTFAVGLDLSAWGLFTNQLWMGRSTPSPTKKDGSPAKMEGFPNQLYISGNSQSFRGKIIKRRMFHRILFDLKLFGRSKSSSLEIITSLLSTRWPVCDLLYFSINLTEVSPCSSPDLTHMFLFVVWRKWVLHPPPFSIQKLILHWSLYTLYTIDYNKLYGL